MNTIKITPNLLFEYQCTSNKFIRLPNRIESKLFLPELECSSMHHYERVALCKDISLQSGRFCARSKPPVSLNRAKTGHHECSSSTLCAAAPVVASISLGEI